MWRRGCSPPRAGAAGSAAGGMPNRYGNFRVFSGSAHIELATRVCERLGIELDPAMVKKFANGETSCVWGAAAGRGGGLRGAQGGDWCIGAG